MTKTVLITGASSGIGWQTALKYAVEEKANLVIAARNKDKLHELEKILIEIGSQVLVVQTDVTDLSQIKNLVDETVKKFKTIDVLINNAGLGFVNSIVDESDENISTMIDIDLKAVIYLAKYVAIQMIKQKSGHIVNISSIAGYFSIPNWSVYCAAKFGVRAFSDSIRNELRKHSIRVTSIHPGPIKTNFFNRGEISVNESSMLSVEKLVDIMYLSINQHKKRVIIPSSFSFVEKITRPFPGLVDFFARFYK